MCIRDRIDTAKRHLEMAIKWKGERLGVLETRRHYSNYFRGIQNFKPYRTKLVTTDSSEAIFEIFGELKSKKHFTEKVIA